MNIIGIMKANAPFFIGSVLCMHMGFATMTPAQVISDEELFDRAESALKQQDFLKTSTHLFAYVQRNPLAIRQDADHAKSVQEVLRFCEEKVRFAFLQAAQSTTARNDREGFENAPDFPVIVIIDDFKTVARRNFLAHEKTCRRVEMQLDLHALRGC